MAQILPMPRRAAGRLAPARWRACAACEARISEHALRCPGCGARRVEQEEELDWTEHSAVVATLAVAIALPALVPTLVALLLR